MWILAADVAALLGAPGLDALVRRSPGWSAFVTDLCRAAVAGIVLLHLLPHAWHELGLTAVVLFVAGAAGVVWAERWTAQRDSTVLGWAAAALGAHHLADGVGLALAATEPQLGVAVVLHAVPVALVTWRLGVAQGGAKVGWALVVWLVVATVLGFAVGRLGAGMVIAPVAVGVACALGGGLLHALSHVPHDTHHPRASGLGVVAGLVLVAALVMVEPLGELGTVETIGRLTLGSAPALLVGFSLAGLAAMILPPRLDPSRGEPRLPLPALALSFPLLGPGIALLRVGVATVVAVSDRPREVGATAAEPSTGWERMVRGWQVGAVEVPDRVLPWFGAGLLVAALLEPVLDPMRVAAVPSVLQVPVLAALGAPLVSCATGITPVAAVLLHRGVSAGAVLAFLVAAPVRASSWWATLGLTLVATALGIGVDLLLPGLVPAPLPGLRESGPVAWVSTAALVGLGATSLIRQGGTAFVARIRSPFNDPATRPH